MGEHTDILHADALAMESRLQRWAETSPSERTRDTCHDAEALIRRMREALSSLTLAAEMRK